MGRPEEGHTQSRIFRIQAGEGKRRKEFAMTTQQQLASNLLPTLSDCRRALDRVEIGVEIALAVSVALLAWAIVHGM
jgi:hypothetical protein